MCIRDRYGKVYIMLGINELGWPYVDVFAEKYAEMVRAVRDAQPDAQIYICLLYTSRCV